MSLELQMTPGSSGGVLAACVGVLENVSTKTSPTFGKTRCVGALARQPLGRLEQVRRVVALPPDRKQQRQRARVVRRLAPHWRPPANARRLQQPVECVLQRVRGALCEGGGAAISQNI